MELKSCIRRESKLDYYIDVTDWIAWITQNKFVVAMTKKQPVSLSTVVLLEATKVLIFLLGEGI